MALLMLMTWEARREKQMREMHVLIQCLRKKIRITNVCHDVYKRKLEFVEECCPEDVNSEYQIQVNVNQCLVQVIKKKLKC